MAIHGACTGNETKLTSVITYIFALDQSQSQDRFKTSNCQFTINFLDKFDQFWSVNRKLMEHSGEELFKHVPFRIHQVSNNISFLLKCSY